MPSNAPITRLIDNAKARLIADPKDAETLLLLARLYSMQYASAANVIDIYDPDSPHLPSWNTVQVKSERTHRAQAEPLWNSLETYKSTLQIDPKNPLATLGYAWMQEEAAKWVAKQPKDKCEGQPLCSQTENEWLKGAAATYELAYKRARSKDLAVSVIMRFPDTLISQEAAENLLRLQSAGKVKLTKDQLIAYKKSRSGDEVQK